MESSSTVHWQSQCCKFRTLQTAPHVFSHCLGECLSHLPEGKKLSRESKGQAKRQQKASQNSSRRRQAAVFLQGREKLNTHTDTHTHTHQAARALGGGRERNTVWHSKREMRPSFSSRLPGRNLTEEKQLVDLIKLHVLPLEKFKLSVYSPLASAIFHRCSLGPRSVFLFLGLFPVWSMIHLLFPLLMLAELVSGFL